ncbi:MAG: hypothetical protein ACFFEU_02150 [Candidatus Thorarchaeota archaeon]|jgi:hypothetical protein
MARSLKKAWWALTFVFAAIQMVTTLFPANIPIAGTGIHFSINLISAPVIGYLLGPFYAAVSVFLGTFVGAIIDPSTATLLMPLGILGALVAAIPPTTGAFVAGLIKKGRHRVVPLVFIVAIGLFLFTRIGLASLSFLWLHIIALFLSLLFMVPQLKNFLKEGLDISAGTSYPQATIAMFLLVFISVMADHIVASDVIAYLLLPAPVEWVSFIYSEVILIYPLEGILEAIVGTIATILLAVAISRANLYLPTHPIAGKEIDSIEPLKEEALARSRDIEEMNPSEDDS